MPTAYIRSRIASGANKMDFSRYRRILTLAAPIIGGMASQNLLNLVDTAMVGHLGAPALAATGIGGFTNFLAISLILGLSSGVQAIASRRLGEGKTEFAAQPLHGGILIAVGFGLPLTLLLAWLAPYFFPYLNADPEVIALGVPYLQVRLIAGCMVGVNFSFRGFWNGVQRSSIYMTTLVVMHITNIFLNWVFIYGNLGAPAYGVFGSGLATSIAVTFGTLLYAALSLRDAREFGFLRVRPTLESLRILIRQSVPSGLQQLFFSAGLTALFWIIGKVGTHELAAANVLTNLMLVAFLPGLGLGLGGASLVGAALGRGDAADAKRWGWDVALTGAVLLGLIGLPMVLIPELLLTVFINDADALALAVGPLRLAGLAMAFEGVSFALMNCLLGAGDSRRVMILSISLQWGLFLPAAYVAGPLLGAGLTGIWVINLAYRMLLALSFYVAWRGGRWSKISV